ncbi:endoplasmic reticulum junction formation protein lunapark-A isoform X3 [Bacillus rossius redtenbacheri]|uniref:endoplasmic reticulum junction formation protein lunapark-A isoform X3 n=1 Tax=Bacillus rossius redtenbacheri TaxID=93214 RepID=UPI002FDE871A
MGVLFSRFKKKAPTSDILESLEQKIKSIEENRVRAEQRQRRIVGHLILYSIGLYIIAAFLFYLFFFPAPLKEQIIYITPMLIFPVLVVFLKKLVSWYYHRKLLQDQKKLQKMREKKKKMLEEVMDKETYKVAKEILEKYAPDQLRKQAPLSPTQLKSPLLTSSLQPRLQLMQRPVGQAPSSEVELRRRSIGQAATNKSALLPPGARSMSLSLETVAAGQINGRQRGVSGPPMPRPIFPRERSYADKLMEYILGDGPGNRYALICKQCESHNGMALKEEFEYLAFRCCYCFYWNPARKQRPHAPALALPAATNQDISTSSSELNSASSSEDGLYFSHEPAPEDSAVAEVPSEGSEPRASEPGELPAAEAVATDNEAGGGEEAGDSPCRDNVKGTKNFPKQAAL